MKQYTISINFLEYIEYFVNYLQSHVYIKLINIVKEFICDSLGFSYKDKQFAIIKTKLVHNQLKLTRIVLKLGYFEKFAQGVYKISNNRIDFNELLKTLNECVSVNPTIDFMIS